MEIISRKEWGAREPRDVDKTNWSSRTGFAVHYSGTSVEPTPKSVQNYHMDTRGWSDIGYNFVVSNSTGKIYEGRGWLVIGAHIANHNTPNIGVCILKRGDEPITPEAMAAVRWLADEADRRKAQYDGGKRLKRLCHRDLASTDCPGDQVYKWVHAGMPLPSRPGPSPTPTPTPEPQPKPTTFTEEIMRALPTVRAGHHDRRTVKTVQGLMNRDGAALLEDGVFGPKTDNAVRAWQVKNDVKNSVRADGTGDGAFGPECWRVALDLA